MYGSGSMCLRAERSGMEILMFILSQNKMYLLEMCGMEIDVSKHDNNDGTLFKKSTTSTRINLICYCKNAFSVETESGDPTGSYTMQIKVGTFRNIKRAKQEMMCVYQALSDGAPVYAIREDAPRE